MVKIDYNTNDIILRIYEGGISMYAACLILELNIDYERNKAREIIRQFLEKFPQKENRKHPILNFSPQLTRQLVEYLQSNSKGISINLFPDPPSVW